MTKTKQEHIPVFYEGQDDLIDILATSMVSVCYNTKSFIDFYILDCGICDFNKRLLETLKEKFDNFSIEYVPVDFSKFKGLSTYKGFNDCYARLLFPELKKGIDKAIYLDTDTIAIGDIQQIWKQNMGDYEIAGVPDVFYGNFPFIKATKISPKQKFMNAGLLLIDCNKWRKNKRTKQCFEIAKKYNKYLGAIIEDILNIVYNNNNYKQLPFRYCYSELPNTSKQLGDNSVITQDLLEERNNAVIVHFSGLNKPWLRRRRQYQTDYITSVNDTLYHFSSFWFFAKMTPFYESLNNLFLHNSLEHILGIILQEMNRQHGVDKKDIILKLFNYIPLLVIRKKNEKTYYKLFGFIPLFKTNEKER